MATITRGLGSQKAGIIHENVNCIFRIRPLIVGDSTEQMFWSAPTSTTPCWHETIPTEVSGSWWLLHTKPNSHGVGMKSVAFHGGRAASVPSASFPFIPFISIVKGEGFFFPPCVCFVFWLTDGQIQHDTAKANCQSLSLLKWCCVQRIAAQKTTSVTILCTPKPKQ